MQATARLASLLVFAALPACAIEEPTPPSEATAAQEVSNAPLVTQPAWSVFWIQGASGDRWCSASMLNERWLLTAAHCLEHFEPDPPDPPEPDTPEEFFFEVFFADTLAHAEELFSGRGRKFIHPGHSGSGNPIHDVALIYLEDAGVNLAVLGRAKLYADPREPWNDSSEPAAMAIAGWGLNNIDCDDEPSWGDQQLRLGTGLNVDFNPYNDHFASASIPATHMCGGDSGGQYLLHRGTGSDADFLQFAVHSGRRYMSLPFQLPTKRHQGPLIADNIAWIESTITAWTSQVVGNQWVDRFHGGFRFRQSTLSASAYSDIQGFGYRCMTDVGGLVELRTCDGTDAQRWRFDVSGEIARFTGLQRERRCLHLAGSPNSTIPNRTQLRVVAGPLCNGSLNQKFWYDTSGRLRATLDFGGEVLPDGSVEPGGHKCVEVGGTYNGAPVQIFDCNGSAAQMWQP